MKEFSKKIIATIILLVLILGMMPLYISNADEALKEGKDYRIVNLKKDEEPKIGQNEVAQSLFEVWKWECRMVVVVFNENDKKELKNNGWKEYKEADANGYSTIYITPESEIEKKKKEGIAILVKLDYETPESMMFTEDYAKTVYTKRAANGGTAGKTKWKASWIELKKVEEGIRWRILISDKAKAKYPDTTETQIETSTQTFNQPLKRTADEISVPKSVVYDGLSEEAYIEYIKQLLDIVNKNATDEMIELYKDKNIGETTIAILENKIDVGAEELSRILKEEVAHIASDNVLIEKIETFLSEKNITEKDAILLFLNNETVRNYIIDYYTKSAQRKLTGGIQEGKDSLEEIQKRIAQRGSTIDKDLLESYLIGLYGKLTSDSDELDNELLNKILEYYDNGYDLEDCVLELIKESNVLEKVDTTGKNATQIVEDLYVAIINYIPESDEVISSEIDKLSKGESLSDIADSIINSVQFEQLKQSLINKDFDGNIRWDEYKTRASTSASYSSKIGDLDGDGELTCNDAQAILQIYVDALAGNEAKYGEEIIKQSDVDKDGMLTAQDAQVVLQYYVSVVLGKSNKTLEDIVRELNRENN